MNEINPLVQHEVAIKEIFTYERLPAILAVLSSLRPEHSNFLKEDEFKTIVYSAQIDAMDNIQRKLVQFVINNNNLPQNGK